MRVGSSLMTRLTCQIALREKIPQIIRNVFAMSTLLDPEQIPIPKFGTIPSFCETGATLPTLLIQQCGMRWGYWSRTEIRRNSRQPSPRSRRRLISPTDCQTAKDGSDGSTPGRPAGLARCRAFQNWGSALEACASEQGHTPWCTRVPRRPRPFHVLPAQQVFGVYINFALGSSNWDRCV